MRRYYEDITPRIKTLFTYTPIPAYEQYIGSYLCQGDINVLIDPGPKTAVNGLLEAIDAAGVQLSQIEYVILTHIHIDHAGGTGTLLKSLPHARVVVHERGVRHMAEPTALYQASLDTLGELVKSYGEIEPVPGDRLLVAVDGMRLDPGGTDLEIILTPGHSAHHLCVFHNGDKAMFTGDGAGILHNGLLRLTTPPPFRFQETMASLDKIIGYHPEFICYGHLGGFDNAGKRLEQFRELLLDWYEFAQAKVKEGKTVGQTLDAFIERDPGLKDYFDRLDEDSYKRDYGQLTNTVNGLMHARQ